MRGSIRNRKNSIALNNERIVLIMLGLVFQIYGSKITISYFILLIKDEKNNKDRENNVFSIKPRKTNS